jgi:hypothetical protein
MEPSLEMAGAGLYDDARIKPARAHGFHHGRLGAIEIDQNVACVLASGVGVNVDGAARAIAGSQELDDRRTRHLIGSPESLTGPGPSGPVVNQAGSLGIAASRRRMACQVGKTAVFHDRNPATKTNRRTMDLQRTANRVLTVCLTPGGRPSRAS